MLRRLSHQLYRPVDLAPLVLFRIFFGLVVAAECWAAIATGWVKRVFVDSQFTFPFFGFEFLTVLHGPTMYLVYGVMGLLGVLIALGLRYRPSIVAFALLWACSFLQQKTFYHHYYWLLLIVAIALVFMPAHHSHSLDVRRGAQAPSNRTARWVMLVFQGTMATVYISMGLARLQEPFLSLQPFEVWQEKSVLLQAYLPTFPWLTPALAYGMLGLELALVPLLAWRRTRSAALWLGLLATVLISVVFPLGFYPYFTLAMAVFFFPGAVVRRRFRLHRWRHATSDYRPPAMAIRHLQAAIITLYFAVMVFLPLRHHLFPGPVDWTEQGARASWRSVVRSKQAYAQVWWIDQYEVRHAVDLAQWLTPAQQARVAIHPDMMLQLAHVVRDAYQEPGAPPPKVVAKVMANWNGTGFQPLVDPTVDLAAQQWHPWSAAEWVVLP